MGFLTSAGQIRSILALPARALQGSAGLYVAVSISDPSKFFAINDATFRSCLNSKLRGWVKSFPDLATELPATLTLG
ncbi:hypothetical protein EGJ09_04870 [Pseudomonas sp. p106]|nr:hypothetical protein EGJ09_04870 [Pseudomonas sp. p106]